MHLHCIFKHVMFFKYKCELTLGLKGVISSNFLDVSILQFVKEFNFLCEGMSFEISTK